jgi:hypothetical protein
MCRSRVRVGALPREQDRVARWIVVARRGGRERMAAGPGLEDIPFSDDEFRY